MNPYTDPCPPRLDDVMRVIELFEHGREADNAFEFAKSELHYRRTRAPPPQLVVP